MTSNYSMLHQDSPIKGGQEKNPTLPLPLGCLSHLQQAPSAYMLLGLELASCCFVPETLAKVLVLAGEAGTQDNLSYSANQDPEENHHRAHSLKPEANQGTVRGGSCAPRVQGSRCPSWGSQQVPNYAKINGILLILQHDHNLARVSNPPQGVICFATTCSMAEVKKSLPAETQTLKQALLMEG